MKKRWIVMPMAAAVAVAIIWMARGQENRDAAADSRVPSAQHSVQPRFERFSVPPPACAPLSGGGYSCGACRDDEDCPAKSGCLLNLASGRTECRGSDCVGDADCDEGNYCRVVARTSRGEPVRSCVHPGVRPPGAACDPDDGSDSSVSCAADLLCVDGGCAPRCVPNDISEPSQCPGDLPCVLTESGWGCTPTCKRQPCGDGKTCSFLSVEGPISLCTYAEGKNCLGSKGGCPDDHDCVVETNPRTERTTFDCVLRCDPDDPVATCPENAVCVPANGTGHCRRQCTPDGAQPCERGERCASTDGMTTGFCSAT